MALSATRERQRGFIDRLQQLAAFPYFSSKAGPFVGVDEIESEEDGLALALTFEEATLELCLVLRDWLGPRGRGRLVRSTSTFT